MEEERRELILQLDQTREKLEKLLPTIDPRGEIYPGWTIRELLAHMTGWDDCTIDALKNHVIGREPGIAAIHSLDKYNRMTVASRAGLDFQAIEAEWRLTRQVLRTILLEMPEGRFEQPVRVPWGGMESVAGLVKIFHEHEEEHTRDILEWAKDPVKTLGKEGN